MISLQIYPGKDTISLFFVLAQTLSDFNLFSFLYTPIDISYFPDLSGASIFLGQVFSWGKYNRVHNNKNSRFQNKLTWVFPLSSLCPENGRSDGATASINVTLVTVGVFSDKLSD